MSATIRSTFSLACAIIFFNQAVSALNSIASPRDTALGQIGNATISINYGSPSVKGRSVWGKLVPYGKVWRTGANEATVFKTTQNLKVEGQDLPAGEYSLFTIPGEKEWTVIFNKTSLQWGAFEYNEKDDALRVKVKPETTSDSTEKLNFQIDESGLSILWEKLKVPINIGQ